MSRSFNQYMPYDTLTLFNDAIINGAKEVKRTKKKKTKTKLNERETNVHSERKELLCHSII